ncbi:MAG TPA: DUF294 nucleotidyltransferase-like domain-containing protein, partial [Ignavibacteriaceae bacterium]|nr:DUF294 nucleotidyltransferase-like domain-containing protein [Ignavibacteriaceae bacterium]
SALQKSFHLSYLFFSQRIHESTSVKELKAINEEVTFLIRQLIQRQTNVKDITKLITNFSDSIYHRTVELAIKQLGVPPVDFSFIVLGSAGRLEQTLATDQDTAIIYDDVSVNIEESTNQYFIKLGEMVSTDLNNIGYSYCKGGIMAQNPKWCKPISLWKEYFTNWITNSSPQDLLEIKIFFDFRCIYGEKELTNQLEQHVWRISSGYNSFFVFLSDSITRFQIQEGAIKHKSNFDIKLFMLPIIDYLRLQSLTKKLTTNNSLERIEQLYTKGNISKQFYFQLKQITTFLLGKRFEHQAEQLNIGNPADNFVNPSEFSEIDFLILKKATSLIEDIQSRTNMEFKGIKNI